LLLIIVLVLSVLGYIPLPIRQVEKKITQIPITLASPNPVPQGKASPEEILFKAFLSKVYNDFIWHMDNVLQYGKDDDTWLFALYDATTGSRDATTNIFIIVGIAYNLLLLGKIEEAKKIFDTIYSLSTTPWKLNYEYNLTSNSATVSSTTPDIVAFFCSFSLSLYLSTKNNTYLQYAEELINTYMQYAYYDGRISKKVYEDSLTREDVVNTEYENIFIIYGLIPLYLVTKNETYLSIAEKIVNWYMSRRTDNGLISFEFNFTTGEPLAPDWYTSSPVTTSISMLSSIVVLLNLYFITENSTYLELAKEVADSTISYIYNPSLRGFKHSIELYTLNDAYDSGKIDFWMQRFSIGLAWLYKLTNNETYLEPLIGLCNEWWERRSQNCGFITNQYDATTTVVNGYYEQQSIFGNIALILYQVTGNSTYLYMIRDLYLTIMPKYKAQYGFVLEVDPSTGSINNAKIQTFAFNFLLYLTPKIYETVFVTSFPPSILAYYYNNAISIVGLNFVSKMVIPPTDTISLVYLDNNECLVFDCEQVYINGFVSNITIVLGDYHSTLPHIEKLTDCEVNNVSFDGKILSYKVTGTGTVTQVIYLGKYRNYLVDSVLKDNVELQEVSSFDELETVSEGYYVSSNGRIYIKVNLASESEIKVVLSNIQLLVPNAVYKFENGKLKLVSSSLLFYEDFNKPDILKHTWLLLNYTILRTPYGIAFNKTYHGAGRETMYHGCISLKGNWSTGYYVIKAYLKGASALSLVLHSDWSKPWFSNIKPPAIHFNNVLITHTFMKEVWSTVTPYLFEYNDTTYYYVHNNYNITVDEGWHTVVLYYNGTYIAVYIDGNFTLGYALTLSAVINKTFPWLSLVPCEDETDVEPFTEEGYEIIIAYIEYYDLQGNLIFREDWSHCMFVSGDIYTYTVTPILPQNLKIGILNGVLNVTNLASGYVYLILPYNTTYIITRHKHNKIDITSVMTIRFLPYTWYNKSYVYVFGSAPDDTEFYEIGTNTYSSVLVVDKRVHGSFTLISSISWTPDTSYHTYMLLINGTELIAKFDTSTVTNSSEYAGIVMLRCGKDSLNQHLFDYIFLSNSGINYITITDLPKNAYIKVYDIQGNLIASVKAVNGVVNIPLSEPMYGYIVVLLYRSVLPSSAVIVSYDANNYTVTLEGNLDYNALTVNFTGSLYIDGITTTITLYVKLLKPLTLTKLELNGTELTFSFYGTETINGLEYNVYNTTVSTNGTLVVYASLNASIKYEDVVCKVGKISVSECLVNDELNITLPTECNVTVTISNLKYTFTNVNYVLFKPPVDGTLSIVVLLNNTGKMKYGLVKKDIIVRYGKIRVKPIDLDNTVVGYTNLIVRLVNKTDGSIVKEVVGANEILLDSLLAHDYEIQLIYNNIIVGKLPFTLNITTDDSLLTIPCNLKRIIDYRSTPREVVCEYDKTLKVVNLNKKFEYAKTRYLVSGEGNFTLMIYYEAKPTKVNVLSNVTVTYYWSGNYLVIEGKLSSTADVIVVDLYKLTVEIYDMLGNLLPNDISFYINTTEYKGSLVETYLMPEDYVIKLPKDFVGFKLVNSSDIYITISDSNVVVKVFYKVPTKITYEFKVIRETNYTVTYKINGYLKDYYDNPLVNKTVYITIENLDTGASTTYNVTTDVTGYFEVEVTLVKNYDYEIKISYEGDDVYTETSYLKTVSLKAVEVVEKKGIPLTWIILGIVVVVIIVIVIVVKMSKTVKKSLVLRPRKYIKIGK